MAQEPQDAWVERVLGIKIPRDPHADQMAKLHAAHDKLKPALDRAKLISNVIADAIAEQEAAFAAGVSAEDEAAARAAVFELATLSRRTDAADAAQVIPAGTVANTRKILEAALKRWDGALSAACSSASALQAELESYFPEQAGKFAAALDSHWAPLADALKQAQNNNERAGVEAMRRTAETVRATMMTDELLSLLDSNGVQVRPAFISALDDVGGLLASQGATEPV
jgi:hypothetical protein